MSGPFGGPAVALRTTAIKDVFGLPQPTAVFVLDDPGTFNAGQGNTVANLKGGNSLACFQAAYGVTTAAPSIVYGDPSATCTIFSKAARPVIEATVTGSDNTGGAVYSGIATIFPMDSRTGPARLMHVQGKRATDTISAGWTQGVYWTGTKLVAALAYQGATLANDILVIGSTDLTNFTPWVIGFTGSATKTAASKALYVNGVLEPLTVVSDTLGTDSATNAGNYSIGGLGGSRNGTNDSTDTNLGLNGSVYGASLWTGTALSVTQHAKNAGLTSPNYVQPKTGGATAVPLLIYTDVLGDVDDCTAIMVAAALHLRGEARIRGVIVTQGNDKGAPFVRALLDSLGLNEVPVAAYTGGGRPTTNTWTATACTAFSINSTRASGFADPLTLGRTVLAQNAGVQIVEVGPCQETSALHNSPADSISSLTGVQLVAATGRPLCIMGGYLSNASAEFNFSTTPAAGAPAAAANVFNNWPVPVGQTRSIINSPAETDAFVTYPGNPAIHIARNALNAYGGGAMSTYSATYDPGMALYAVRGLQNYFVITNDGQKNTVNATTGVNTWGGTGTHAALTFATGGAAIMQNAMHQLIAEAIMAMRIPPAQ